FAVFLAKYESRADGIHIGLQMRSFIVAHVLPCKVKRCLSIQYKAVQTEGRKRSHPKADTWQGTPQTQRKGTNPFKGIQRFWRTEMYP
ncbi:hypothetical protein EZS27_039222, partial [termite gut metagenome]